MSSPRERRQHNTKLRIDQLPDVHPVFGPHHKKAALLLYEAVQLQPTSRRHAVGCVIGALQAKNLGLQKIYFIEFGVATGKHFRVLLNVADLIRQHFDLQVEVLGFDNRSGLPAPQDYRDHPEIWSENQFQMGEAYHDLDREAQERVGKLVIGDIAETLPAYAFPEFAKPEIQTAALGFCAIDVDYYSSTVPILAWLETLPHQLLLPGTPLYFDDVFVNWTYSAFAGEQLAIHEFNERQSQRKIELKEPDMKLYTLQAFDHPVRTGANRQRIAFEIFVQELKRYFY